MRTLYLGLRPPPSGVFHYPVIRTQCCSDLKEVVALWPQFTHLIFTSQTAVEYWPGPWDKEVLSIGESTASLLKKKGIESLRAPFPTQEGVIELIRDIKGHFLLPQSRLARSVLSDYMEQRNIPFYSFVLYDTHFQKLEPVPPLEDFDEIIFTSPSTVDGFLRIYRALPLRHKLTAIGPITHKKLVESLKEREVHLS